jgi:tetratricopeptide (TPR) repeat protein
MYKLISTLLILSISLAQQTANAAFAAFEKKDFEKAIDLFDDYLDDNETDINARFYLGQAYFHIKEFEDASDEFEEIIDLGSKNALHFKWYMDALNEDAQVSSSLGQLSIGKKMVAAIVHFHQVKPDSLPIQEQYIRTMINAPSFVGGDEEAGLKSLKQFEQKAPYRASLLYFDLYLNNDEIDKAEAELKKLEAAENKDKNFYVYYNRYGYYLLKNKRIKDAVKAFERQVELAPKTAANPYDSLGDGYKAAGQIEKAKAAYRKAIEIDPTLEASKKNLAELE